MEYTQSRGASAQGTSVACCSLGSHLAAEAAAKREKRKDDAQDQDHDGKDEHASRTLPVVRGNVVRFVTPEECRRKRRVRVIMDTSLYSLCLPLFARLSVYTLYLSLCLTRSLTPPFVFRLSSCDEAVLQAKKQTAIPSLTSDGSRQP